MVISACGLVCSDCEFYQKQCAGCREVKGQTFWAVEHLPNKVCPLYNCAVNERGYKDCGGCSELPCTVFREMKDPSSTDEQHQQGLIDRVARLKKLAEA